MMKSAGYRQALCVAYLLLFATVNSSHADSIATEQLVIEAEAVVQSISDDNVQAAKHVDTIFVAANRLFAEGRSNQRHVATLWSPVLAGRQLW